MLINGRGGTVVALRQKVADRAVRGVEGSVVGKGKSGYPTGIAGIRRGKGRVHAVVPSGERADAG